MSLFFRSGGGGEGRSKWVDFGGTSWPVGGGAAVTKDTATRMASVFAAQARIHDFISTLPLEAFREDAGGRKRVPAPQLLRAPDQPGGPGLATWLGQAVLGLINGNAVGWIPSINGTGYPAEVQWLHWSQWSYSEEARQWYVMGSPMPSSRIVHIPWIVPPGCTLGLSPIEHFASVVRAGLSAQEYADIKRGGGIPPTVLKNTSKTLDAEQSRIVKKRAAESFSRGEPFAVGADWDLTATPIPPNHAQFVETLKLTANLVAAIYGIDPTEVAGEPGGSLTYSTEELRQLRRASDMRPYLTRIERGIDRLLPGQQLVRFDVDATMRTDIKTRTEVDGAQIKDGRKSVNEARAEMDRPPVPGGDFHNLPAPAGAPASRENEGDHHDRR